MFDPETPIERNALLEQLSTPLPDLNARRLRRAGFSIAEACTLAANPHVPRRDVEYAAVLVEGGLVAEPFEAIRAVWRAEGV
jgi:hypothetical protein